MIAEPEYSPQPPHQSIGQGGKAFDYRHLVPGLTFLLCVLRKSFPTERTQGLLKPSAFLFVTQLGSTRHFDLDERKFLAMKARDIPSTERRVHLHFKFWKARCQGSSQSCCPLRRCRGALPVGKTDHGALAAFGIRSIRRSLCQHRMAIYSQPSTADAGQFAETSVIRVIELIYHSLKNTLRRSLDIELLTPAGMGFDNATSAPVVRSPVHIDEAARNVDMHKAKHPVFEGEINLP